MKEGPFLRAVQGVVGGVEIEDDLKAAPRNGFHSFLDQGRLDPTRIGKDLLVFAIASERFQFETLQGRMGRQSLAFVFLTQPVPALDVALSYHQRAQGVRPKPDILSGGGQLTHDSRF